jgi:peptide/nickel transport system permease protein
MKRYLAKRLGLAVITLVLLSMIAFAVTQLLPGDVGRNVLGQYADQRTVDEFNAERGLDRPFYVQYGDWITDVLSGDLGTSMQFDAPIAGMVGPALVNSLKLAALALLILVPLSIALGTVAGLRAGTPLDRGITLSGLSLACVPEFVTSIVLIVIFAVGLGWLPAVAQAPDGASPLTQVEYLVLPSLALVTVLWGYVARITRAGVIEAVDSDYVRTAYMAGLKRRRIITRHILRNGLLPTIAVIATQMGYVIGGLVVIEKLFNYPGIGQRMYVAASTKDYAMLEACILIAGVAFLVATLIADVLYSLLNPRIRAARGS